jgi:hypothetical protein
MFVFKNGTVHALSLTWGSMAPQEWWSRQYMIRDEMINGVNGVREYGLIALSASREFGAKRADTTQVCPFREMRWINNSVVVFGGWWKPIFHPMK